MTNREVIFRGGVAKLDKPKGQRPSETKITLKSSVVYNKQIEKVASNQ